MGEFTNISQIYAEAMHACLENAIRWLEDAKVLAEHDSNPHCRVLQFIASEELAKTAGCWLVVNNHLKDTHPLVRGVFRDHDVKYLVWAVLGSFAQFHTMFQKLNSPITRLDLEQCLQNPEDDSRYLKVAWQGELSRQIYQYVDVFQKNDSWMVSNPLQMDIENFLKPAPQQEIINYATGPIIRPFPQSLQEADFAKQLVELTETDKSAYDNAVREVEFIKYLIKHPRSDIAQLFHEEILAIYKLFEINRKQIKKDRKKRKYL